MNSNDRGRINSIKCKQSPGGNSQFSLGWSNSEPEVYVPKMKRSNSKVNYNIVSNELYDQNGNVKTDDKENYSSVNVNQIVNVEPMSNGDEKKSSTKVTQAPGGKSTICFGNDSASYDDYRKKR